MSRKMIKKCVRGRASEEHSVVFGELPACSLFPAHTLQNPCGVIVVFHTCVSGCRMSPGSESYSLASSLALGRSPHNRSSPSNLSCSSDASGSSAHWRQKSMPEQ